VNKTINRCINSCPQVDLGCGQGLWTKLLSTVFRVF